MSNPGAGIFRDHKQPLASYYKTKDYANRGAVGGALISLNEGMSRARQANDYVSLMLLSEAQRTILPIAHQKCLPELYQYGIRMSKQGNILESLDTAIALQQNAALGNTKVNDVRVVALIVDAIYNGVSDVLDRKDDASMIHKPQTFK